MAFIEIVDATRTKLEGADASAIAGKLAVQVNVTGKTPGTFYIEVLNGKVSVEPYEYNDRDAEITLTATNYNKLIDRKLDPVLAFTTGKLKVEGNIEKVLEFSKLLKA